METRLSGNAFQILAAATRKARLLTLECLKGGTTRRLVPEDNEMTNEMNDENDQGSAK